MDQSDKTWECKQCTLLNSAAREDCEVCRCKRDSADDMWQCTKCTMFTPVDEQKCGTCAQPRKTVDQARGALTETAKPTGVATVMDSVEEGAGMQLEDSSVHLQESHWVCTEDGCHTPNSDDSFCCSRCKTVRSHLSSLQNAPVYSDWVDNQEETQFKDDWRYRKTVTTNKYALADNLHTFHLGGASWEDLHMGTDDEEVLKFPDSECRIMLVGKTGHGKSSTGNTILGLQKFLSSSGFQSTTKKCQRFNRRRFGIHLEVADTPGLFDTELDEDAITTEIAKCLGIISPGPHAILVVVRIGMKFTAEEVKAVEQVRSIFGMQLLQYLVIVFTCGDVLAKDYAATGGDESAAVKSMIDSSPDALKQLVKEANNRYVVFDNMASKSVKDRQVKRLIETIRDLLKVNGGRPYTSDMLAKVEECMLLRESEIIHDLHRNRQRGGGTGAAAQKQQARDMARDELTVQGSPLLQRILDEILPILRPCLRQFLQLLMSKVVTKVVGYCSVQ